MTQANLPSNVNDIQQVAVIGAGTMGHGIAQVAAQSGAAVTLIDINDEAGEEHAAAIGGTFHHVDIMDEASAQAGFAEARAQNGQERVLVHC
ncbi:MAG TPA: SDR family oxidoreductase, partial [Cytophagales bacterium]|nr:SDR family oxidoreductase [Cytophagales bacterium]